MENRTLNGIMIIVFALATLYAVIFLDPESARVFLIMTIIHGAANIVLSELENIKKGKQNEKN